MEEKSGTLFKGWEIRYPPLEKGGTGGFERALLDESN